MLLTFASRGADALAGNHLSSIVTSVLLAAPALSVTVRRFHDTGHSAWALLAGLVPVLGEFWALFWLVHAGSPGANKYGPPTQAVSPGAAAPAFVPQVRPRRRTYIDADGNVTRQEFE